MTLPSDLFGNTSLHSHDKKLYNIRPRSLEECFRMFDEIPKCVNDLSSLARVTREALQDLAEHHVAYLELRSGPKVLLRNYRNREVVSSKTEYIETVVTELKAFEAEEKARYKRDKAEGAKSPRLPMICRFIVSIDRSKPLEESQENVDLAIAFRKEKGNMIVGVDLGGNPMRQTFADFRPALERARKAGLKLSVHCGEVAYENHPTAYDELEDIFAFGPDRLGHALMLPDEFQKKLLCSRIPVEVCPTSNIMTLELAKAAKGDLVHGFTAHPSFESWLDSDHPISISTDDPGVFDTTPTQELHIVAMGAQCTKEQLSEMILKSSKLAFCEDAEMIKLRLAMQECIKNLLGAGLTVGDRG